MPHDRHIQRHVGSPAVAAYYDTLGFWYHWFYSPHGLHYGLWHPQTRSLAEALDNHKRFLFQLLTPSQGCHVLDAGCGNGATAIALAERHGCHVTGITVSKRQKLRAEKLAASRGLSSAARFANADFCDTGMADGMFERAYASESSCYAPDMHSFLQEMYRLLAPGGRLVIADFYLHQPPAEMSVPQQHIYNTVIRGFALPRFPTWQTMQEAIGRSGFILSKVQDVSEAVAPTARRIRLLGTLALPFAQVLAMIRLAPPILIDLLMACIQQPPALELLGSYRFVVLDKPR